jgi:hypothetical protein
LSRFNKASWSNLQTIGVLGRNDGDDSSNN